MLLGGRAAEKLIFNTRTTRAENDLVQATDIATNMICQWGMSEALGPQAYAVEENSFLNAGSRRLIMSNDTASLIDREVKTLLTSCYNHALSILEGEMVFLKSLTEILIQVETLDSEEFEIIYQCSLTKKANLQNESADNECEMCPAKGHCLHYKDQQ